MVVILVTHSILKLSCRLSILIFHAQPDCITLVFVCLTPRVSVTVVLSIGLPSNN